MMMGNALETGSLETMQDGPFSWATHDDLAEAAATILIEEGRFDGPTPPLTGSEAVDFADMAAMAQELTGKPVRRTVIGEDHLRKNVAARGAPTGAADMMVGVYTAARNGEFAEVSPLLQDLIGRAPQKIKDVMAAHIKG